MRNIFPFLILFFLSSVVYSQNDCADAIIICGNANYQGLTATGTGMQEISNNNACSSMEHNSLWLALPIKTGGTLGFTLIPENTSITVDFDFFIFGPNASCSNLGQAIRCSTTNPAAAGSGNNHTGMNSVETDVSEGPGQLGNNFVKELSVQAGETYFLVIDRPIGSSDFSIEWSGTAAFHDIPVLDPEIVLDQEKCDDDGVDDQSVAFDLTASTTALTANQANVVLSFHENLNDVTVGSNAIPNPQNYANTSNPQHIFVRLTNTVTGCYSTKEFSIEVVHTLVAGQPKDLFLCDTDGSGFRQFDLSLNDKIVQNGTSHTITYYTSLENAQNQTNPIENVYQNHEAYTAQEIWVRMDSTGPCFGHVIKSFTINIVPIPEFVYSLKIVDFTNDNNSITIEMEHPENYLFSIDGEYYSSHPTFNNLPNGVYTIYIKDKMGCAELSEDVVVLNYPKFFTPNGDGHNDVWKIPYLKPAAEIKIFDRYGKLLSTTNRWNGTYNGKRLPSSDYWFVLKLSDQRVIKGHFSLKR